MIKSEPLGQDGISRPCIFFETVFLFVPLRIQYQLKNKNLKSLLELESDQESVAFSGKMRTRIFIGK